MEGKFDEKKRIGKKEGKKKGKGQRGSPGARLGEISRGSSRDFLPSLGAPSSSLRSSTEYLGPHTRIEADGDESLARYGSSLAATWKSLNGLYPAAYSRAVRLQVRTEDRRDSGVKLRRS